MVVCAVKYFKDKIDEALSKIMKKIKFYYIYFKDYNSNKRKNILHVNELINILTK